MRPSFAILLVALSGSCSRKAPEVHSAQAATAAPRAAEGKEAKEAQSDNTPPPGVDISRLDDFERKVFFRIVNKEPSACGKAHSLIHSVRNDPGCRKSVYAVKVVARFVDSGHTDSEIAESLQKRFRAGARKTIDVGDAPMKGGPAARVTLVEFVDYECPHCKRVQPVLRQALDEFRDDVKLYFKHYPLGGHTNSRLAAEAAVAAHRQGKFWPYNEKLWASSDSLTPALLEQIAKDLGLDVDRWRKDAESPETKMRVQKDRDEGGALGIASTPTIYLNGREFTDTRDVESLRDWISEDLGR